MPRQLRHHSRLFILALIVVLTLFTFSLALAAPLAETGAARSTQIEQDAQQSPTVRIQFSPGSSSAWKQGYLGVGATNRYVLGAQKGQTMTVALTSSNNQAILVIWGADGSVLLSDHAGATRWSGTLPSTQDYYIDVRNTGTTSARYGLQVSIPPAPNPSPAPQRIQFAPGATSATVQGQLAANGKNSYVLNIGAGQVLQAVLNSANGEAYLAIHGADGTVLISDHAGAASWSGPVPKTQDYTIDVMNPDYASTSYTLKVTVPPKTGPTPTPAAPTAKRIQFAPGATSATVQGAVAPAATNRWSVQAQGGQIMTVALNSSTGQAILAIWGADGTVLLSDHAGATSWSGPLPKSQVYYIDVRNTGSQTANYTMTVTIPPKTQPQPATQRIRFPSGGTSATVGGTLQASETDRYVLGVSGGQTMYVDLSSDGDEAILVVYGADGTVLLSDHAGASSWSGTVPTTQDYYINVSNQGTDFISYSMTVTIPPK